MGNPYLNKEESITLATHKVMVKSISSDVLLTNQRLIIVESGHEQFLPHTIPLSVIETVSRREDSNGVPEISISIAPPTPDDAPIMVALSFPQISGEVRSQEIEDWTTKLRENVAVAREIAEQMGEKAVYPEAQNVQSTSPSPQNVSVTETIKISPRKQSFRQRIRMGSKPIEWPDKLSERPADPMKVVADSSPIVIPENHEPEPPVVQSAEEIPKPHDGIPTFPQAGPSKRPAIFVVVAIIILILVGAAVILVPGLIPGKTSAITHQVPLVTPISTVIPTLVTTIPIPVQQTPQITMAIATEPRFDIPPSGVWVRITSEGNYTGSIGPAGRMRLVSGSGNQFYQVPARNEIVEIAIQKNDGSGNPLSVEVYNNGFPAGNATTSSPNGAIDLHVNLNTK